MNKIYSTEKQFERLVNIFKRRCESLIEHGTPIAFALRFRDLYTHCFGDGEPDFTLTINDNNGLAAISTFDGTKILEAYMVGSLDCEGDLVSALGLRDILTDGHRFQYLWRFIRPLLFGQVECDKRGIALHYDIDADFYMCFLDKEYRCYSQGVFLTDVEPLETGIKRKLDFAIEATGLKPGDRVLDIGAGWGAFVEYAGRQGIEVTSLTISRESEKFVNTIIKDQNLPCRVIRQHLMEYHSPESYDAIVNMGVTEHLPDYGATLAKYQELLKPGGRIYLDASASRGKKFEEHSFVYRHIFPGNSCFLHINDYFNQLAATPFRLIAVYDDRHSYYLTTKCWATNLDNRKEEVVQQWGELLYRRFQIYLWGSVKGFLDNRLQAYRVVLELP